MKLFARLAVTLALALAFGAALPAPVEASRAVAWIDSTTNDDPASAFTIRLRIAFVGTDVEGGCHETLIEVVIPFSDTLANLRTKLTDGVVAKAASVPNSSGGLGVTQARGQMILPQFQLGQ